MKNFRVIIEFTGLGGTYRSEVKVLAKNSNSAINKASKVIGNRDGIVISVIEEI